MTQAFEFKKIKVLGITNDINVCDCCGKMDLAKTVIIENLEDGLVMHFGTSCAASANKYDSLQAAALAKKEIQKAVNSFNSTVKYARELTWSYLKRTVGVTCVNDEKGNFKGLKLNASIELIDSVNNQYLSHLLANDGRVSGISINI